MCLPSSLPLSISLSLSFSISLFVNISLTLCLLTVNRQAGEPALENGFIPYLGCALQFGANPLHFLRSRQNKYGHIFTCKIAGQFIHFLCDPFSYHSVIRQGRHLDWRKFHFATSVKVNDCLSILYSNISIDLSSTFWTSSLSSGIWSRQLWPPTWLHHREPPPDLSEDPAGWCFALFNWDNDGSSSGRHAEIWHSQSNQGPLGGGRYLCILLQGQSQNISSQCFGMNTTEFRSHCTTGACWKFLVLIIV